MNGYKGKDGFVMKTNKYLGKTTASRIVSFLLVICLCVLNLSVLVCAEDAAAEVTDAKVSIVIVVKNIEVNTKIQADMVELKEFDNINIPKNAIYSLDEVVGKYSAVDLYAGEYVYKEKLSNVSVKVEETKAPLQTTAINKEDYVNVAEYFSPNSGKDVAKSIQEIINANPNRTIYFPDGEYLISSPIVTDGRVAKSVSLYLSDGAIIKASKNWKSEMAMIRLGGVNTEDGAAHSIDGVGSYYSMLGGIVDGNGVANGIAIEGGRETLVKNVLIKNTKVGLSIPKAEVYGSTDADVDDVTIVGTGEEGSKGLYVEGFDCTVTNVNIYDVEIGVHLTGGGTLMKDINVFNKNPEKLTDAKYKKTVGFFEEEHGNWYYDCTVENYATAFKLVGTLSEVDRCLIKWTTSKGGTQTAFEIVGEWHLIIGNCKVEFFDKTTTNTFLKVSNVKTGAIEALMINKKYLSKEIEDRYLRTPIIPIA